MELTGMELTEEQRALRDAVRALLARQRRSAPAGPGLAPGSSPESPPESAAAGRPGYDQALWRRLCGEIGIAGLAVPESYGGAGAGPVETHVVAEELGRGLTPSPFLGSAVLAAQALLASGDRAAGRRLLPAIAGGSSIAALAWTTEAGRWDPAAAACRASSTDGTEPVITMPATPAATVTAATPASAAIPISAATPASASTASASTAAQWLLTGEAHFVLDGDVADVLLVAATTPDGVRLFDVDPRQAGLTRSAVTTMDSGRGLATLRLADAAGQPVGGGRAGSAALARARDLACIALSAEQVGAAQRALELTVAYTKVRVQFGRAIGGFQALQHRMADLHLLVESARSLSYAAASAAAGDAPDLALRAAAAKAYCSEALARVAGEMIQLHGAIGITWEHDAHRYFKRAHSAAQLFGQPAEHVARIAAALI